MAHGDDSMRLGNIKILFCAIGLSGAHSIALCQALQTGMGNVLYCNTLKGDFATAGTSTRTVAYDGAQTPVFGLTVNSLPANATVVAAYANWSYLGNNPQNINNILVDGKAVQGTLSGRGERDLVWGFDYAFAYTADVTNIFKNNGTYQITGATDNLGAQRIGEGLSVVMVYELPDAMEQEVNVYDGYTSTMTSDGSATLDFCNAFGSRNLHFFTNGLDGQDIYEDNFLVEGMDTNGALGLDAAPNAWQGRLGPGAVGHNFYDHAEGDAGAFVAQGANSMTYRTLGFDDVNELNRDAIGHSFAAASFGVVPEPASILGMAMGLGALLLKKSKRQSR